MRRRRLRPLVHRNLIWSKLLTRGRNGSENGRWIFPICLWNKSSASRRRRSVSAWSVEARCTSADKVLYSGNWPMCLPSTWFAGFFQLLRRELLANSILHADETTLMVLKEPGRKARQKSYVWDCRTSGDFPRPVVLYDYQPTRAGECASNFLSGFSGMLHTDGYEAYHCKLLPEITWRDAGRICAGSLQTHSKACQKKCGTDLWGRRDWGSATNDSRLRRTTKNGVFLSARGFRPDWSTPSRRQRPSSPG